MPRPVYLKVGMRCGYCDHDILWATMSSYCNRWWTHCQLRQPHWWRSLYRQLHQLLRQPQRQRQKVKLVYERRSINSKTVLLGKHTVTVKNQNY